MDPHLAGEFGRFRVPSAEIETWPGSQARAGAEAGRNDGGATGYLGKLSAGRDGVEVDRASDERGDWSRLTELNRFIT